MRTPHLLAPALLALLVSSATAHFNMLLPSSASAKKGEVVTFTYQWGHPFEHQLFDAPQPVSVVVLSPDGKKTDLTKSLVKTTVPAEGKKVVAYQFKFTPEQRGDYVFLLQPPPIFMEEDGEFLQDVVKVVLHVQAQKGWDAAVRGEFEVLPLTRPYGLQPGMVFQALLEGGGPTGTSPTPLKSWSGVMVEVERYNTVAPKEMPPDEQITRTVKTDPKGVFAATLPEAGWWCLTAQRDGGAREREGKRYPVRHRSTLWVYVEEKSGGK
jgi:cobalt/nickel transport protein